LWDDFCPESEKKALQRAAGVVIPSRDTTQPICTRDVKNNPYDKRWTNAWKMIYERLSEEEIASLVPTYIKALDSFYESRIRLIGERYGSRVDSWDVVNESATDFDHFGRKAVRGKVFDKSWYGPMPADYAYKAFVWSQKYLSKSAWLNINEYNMDPFFDQVKDLVVNGARIDVVGSQMHLFNPAESVNISRGEFSESAHRKTHPDGIRKVFDVLSQAKLPIHLSEITITAPDNSKRGQMVQAIIMRNLYRAWFAVEKMNGITWWNVVDDCGAPGEPSISGLFTRDLRPKTVYYAMKDLIHREWKTHLTVKAKGGKVSFRGFKGCYNLEWKNPDGTSGSKSIEVK
jgi:GH35 family endo-1,4-beta-xylanase